MVLHKYSIIASEASSVTNCANLRFLVYIFIGERREPHTYRTAAKNLRHIYIYIYIYICFLYIYVTSVSRALAVNARATRKRRTDRLRFNGQYNRLENGYFSSKL